MELDVLPAPVMPTGDQLLLFLLLFLPTMSVMDLLSGASVEGQKNVMVELDVLPAPVMPTGDQLLLFLLIVECDASANYIGLGGCILAVCDGTSVEGSEECDGGAGCTSLRL